MTKNNKSMYVLIATKKVQPHQSTIPLCKNLKKLPVQNILINKNPPENPLLKATKGTTSFERPKRNLSIPAVLTSRKYVGLVKK